MSVHVMDSGRGTMDSSWNDTRRPFLAGLKKSICSNVRKAKQSNLKRLAVLVFELLRTSQAAQ